MPRYASAGDLARAIPAETVTQLFDDNSDGVADDETIDFFIDMAESYVNHKLENIYRIPLVAPIPPIVRYVTVFLTIAFAYDRSPEYVRATGDKMFERGKTLLDDLILGKGGMDIEGMPVPFNEVSSVRSGNPLSPEVTARVFVDGMGDW